MNFTVEIIKRRGSCLFIYGGHTVEVLHRNATDRLHIDSDTVEFTTAFLDLEKYKSLGALRRFDTTKLVLAVAFRLFTTETPSYSFLSIENRDSWAASILRTDRVLNDRGFRLYYDGSRIYNFVVGLIFNAI